MATNPDSKRTLWGVGTPRTMRAHWALHELSLPYESQAIRTRSPAIQTAEFGVLNPRRKIPILQDGDFTITESAAIVLYLFDRYGTAENQLMPSDLFERAKILEWCFYSMTELDATTMYVIRRHEGLSNIYGEAPTAVEACKVYF